MSRTTYSNAKVFTGLGEDDFASAFTVEDDTFSWVGNDPGEGVGTTVDLDGATVIPGLIDVHTHPAYIAMTLGAVACTPPGVNNIEQMVEALRASSASGRGPEVWIEGWGYDESKLVEHRSPTTEDLDRVSTTQPVYVLRSDCHSGVCNSLALEIAGITAQSADPEGGTFGRYADGRPNGVLMEHGANDLLLRAKSGTDYAAEVARIGGCGSHFNARGIVAATDMMSLLTPFDYLEVFRDAQAHGLAQRVNLFYEWSEVKDHGAVDLDEAQRTGRIRVGGIKLFMDGSMSNRTAWMLEPYPDSDSYGMNTLANEDLWAALNYSRRNKIQLAIHVMGDRGIQHLLDTLGDEEPWLGEIPSVRLEHATMINPAQIEQLNAARMNFGVASQIIFFFAEYDSYVENLSSSQFQRAYSTATCFDTIPAFALSSDRPATTWDDPDNVFVSVKAAVTRRAYNNADIVAAQAITVAKALLLYTGRARKVADLGNVGTIEPGNEASFVILDRDIFTTPADELDQIHVARTFLVGEQVFPTPG